MEIGKSKLETAFELNLADEEKILNLLANSYSLPVIDLKKYKVDDKLKSVIDSHFIRKHSLAPFEIKGEVLKIAIPDASKLSLMKNLKTTTQMDPELFAASISDVNEFIEKLTTGERHQAQKTFKVEQVKKKEKNVPIEVESDVINFGDKVIAEAIDLGVASLIPLKYQKIREAILREWDAKRMKIKTSPYGNGNSAGKILNVLEKHL